MSILKKIYSRLNEKIIDRYGLGRMIRIYGFYPQFLPITITGEHGPSLMDEPIKEATEKTSPFYLVTAAYKLKWLIKGKFIIRHPSQFVWYRRANQIYRNANARGSIFFYSHSTKFIKSITDKDRFFESLKSVPTEFWPITLCLHFNDLEADFIEKIEHYGYKWVTLSKSYSDDQIQKFYEVVPSFNYVLANDFTSALLYACEMGIPVSIVFYEDVKYVNQGNTQFDLLEWTPETSLSQRLTHALKIFKGYNKTINQEQAQFTEQILGLDLINSFRNRLKVMICLYCSFFYVAFRKLIGP